jgi:hypothetical protein
MSAELAFLLKGGRAFRMETYVQVVDCVVVEFLAKKKKLAYEHDSSKPSYIAPYLGNYKRNIPQCRFANNTLKPCVVNKRRMIQGLILSKIHFDLWAA